MAANHHSARFAIIGSMEAFTVKLDSSGRVLLPAKVRIQLKLQPGSELIVRLDKGQLVLKTRAQALEEAQEYFSRFRPEGKLLSDELIEERREEARRELED